MIDLKNKTQVVMIQNFLLGTGLYKDVVDGKYGGITTAAVKLYQTSRALPITGVVDEKTWNAMLKDGMAESDPNWPSKPSDILSLSLSEREKLFGKIQFVHKPIEGNRENVQITNGWNKDNLTTVVIPQLIGVSGAPSNGKIFIHNKIAKQTIDMFAAWEAAGLHKLILSWSGSWAPRLIRGSSAILSNHSYATAFDINYMWNQLGKVGAAKGAKGSVRELIPIALEHGFYWGGWFSRIDAMHFEAYKIID
jgi:hypothetical protein